MSSSIKSHKPSFIGHRLFWSIFILVLVHVAGAIGMAFYDTALFSGMTSYNLILMFILLLWNEVEKNIQLLNAFLIAFYVGVCVELVGVNTQLLFGQYSYGSVLGVKFFGVPVLIGVNWFIIVYSTYLTACFLLKNIFRLHIKGHTIGLNIIQSLLGTILAVVFDWLMEPVAQKLNFWYWQDDIVPFYNYACWFIFSFLISLSFMYLKINRSNLFAILLILVQSIFFIFLRLFLN